MDTRDYTAHYSYISRYYKNIIRDFLECVTDQIKCEDCSLNFVKSDDFTCPRIYKAAITTHDLITRNNLDESHFHKFDKT